MLPKNLKVVAEVTPEYVFDGFVIDGVGEKEESIEMNTEHGPYSVYSNSQRYVLFKEKGCTCYKCGATAKKVYLCETGENRAHFNFIVEIDGEEFYLTKDHVHAKSDGGGDVQANYLPMCERCNGLKGSTTTAFFNHYTTLIEKATEKGLTQFVFEYDGVLYLGARNMKNKSKSWMKASEIEKLSN